MHSGSRMDRLQAALNCVMCIAEDEVQLRAAQRSELQCHTQPHLQLPCAYVAGSCKLPADAAVLAGGRIQLHPASYVLPHHLLSALAH
jgi:hypothetical protein